MNMVLSVDYPVRRSHEKITAFSGIPSKSLYLPNSKEQTMRKYFEAPTWDAADGEGQRPPDTCTSARTIRSTKISNATVIDAPHVQYRMAHVGGTFLLGDSVELPLPTSGWHKVEVYCLWFGCRLKTRGPKFTIDMSKARVRTGVSCDVVFDLGK